MKQKEDYTAYNDFLEVKIKKRKRQLLPYKWWIEEKAITDELLKDL